MASVGGAEGRRVEAYAHTLFEAALSEDRVFEDLDPLIANAEAAPEFIAVLSAMVKQGDLDKIDRVLEVYRDLIESNHLSAGRHQADQDSYDDEVRRLARSGVVGVHVTTAIPLDDELRELIKNKCEADLESKVFLIEHVDPSIIGGIVLSARGNHRDASIKMQLDSARKVMTQETKRVEV